jgi:hypothetical protein
MGSHSFWDGEIFGLADKDSAAQRHEQKRRTRVSAPHTDFELDGGDDV